MGAKACYKAMLRSHQSLITGIGWRHKVRRGSRWRGSANKQALLLTYVCSGAVPPGCSRPDRSTGGCR